ncbi:MAG TPA: hypothetical protein VF696_02240 [Candidatus Paceibacterota bacterium]
MKRTTLIVVLIALLVALGAAAYVTLTREKSALPVIEEPAKPQANSYASPDHGLSFSYSPGYFLSERKAGEGARPELSVVLVEDTAENREVLEGRSSAPRDGPTSITVEVYPNPDRLAAEDWVRASTNWTVRTSDAAPFGSGSITGVKYSWDGLYAGKSYVVTEGSHAYVFSVTWMAQEDAMLAEFDRLLETVIITPEEL